MDGVLIISNLLSVKKIKMIQVMKKLVILPFNVMHCIILIKV
jgi:hypothetical protein